MTASVEASNPPPPRAFWRAPGAVIGAVALVVSLLGFGWTLGGHFLGDDFGYVGRFHDYPLAQWPRLFVQSWAGDMWGFQLRELRPITALSFMTDVRLWGGNALGFRAFNLLLHAGGATLVGVLAWRAVARDLPTGLAAAVLFALHPAHAEPVQWITGRVDVLATTFYLAGFLAFLRYREKPRRAGLIALGVIYALAAFSKEFGLTLPLMCCAADVIWQRRWRQARELQTWAPYLVCLLVVVPYFFCRRAAFGPGGMGAGLPDLGSVAFWTQFAQRQLVYVGHLFPPTERWFFEGAPLLAQRALPIFLWIAAGTAFAIALWRWRARHRDLDERRAVVFFGLGWYLVATLPLVVTYISPRHLYLASAGLCVAAAVILRGLLRPRVAYAVVIVALAALFAQRLSTTMKPWHEAARASGVVSAQLRFLEADVKPGAGLLLDVPEITNGAYVWTWAVPFALRPPFTRTRLDERAIVLESRGLYVDWERWHVQPSIAALRKVEAPSWIVQLLPGQPARLISVAPEKMRPAADNFAAAPLKEFPHESWRKLINEATAP